MQKLKQCKTVIYVHIKRYDPGWKTFNENAHTKLAHVGFDFSSFQKKHTAALNQQVASIDWLCFTKLANFFLVQTSR